MRRADRRPQIVLWSWLCDERSLRRGVFWDDQQQQQQQQQQPLSFTQNNKNTLSLFHSGRGTLAGAQKRMAEVRRNCRLNSVPLFVSSCTTFLHLVNNTNADAIIRGRGCGCATQSPSCPLLTLLPELFEVVYGLLGTREDRRSFMRTCKDVYAHTKPCATILTLHVPSSPAASQRQAQRRQKGSRETGGSIADRRRQRKGGHRLASRASADRRARRGCSCRGPPSCGC